MPLELNRSDAGFEAAFTGLLAAKRETQEDVQNAVAAILADVRVRGDAALLEYTARFDRVTLTVKSMRVSAEEIDSALASMSPACSHRSSLRPSGSRTSTGGRLPTRCHYTDPPGSGRRAVDGGGCRRPLCARRNRGLSKLGADERDAGQGRRGRARGDVVPAPERQDQPAGAGRRAISRGWTRSTGSAARRRSRALAYGTETIRPVDKIVGPGNAYVAAAKRQVFGMVGIDMIAGPSEVLVVADGANDPDWIAADLLAQAEHDTARAVDPDHRRCRLRRSGRGGGRRATETAAARRDRARQLARLRRHHRRVASRRGRPAGRPHRRRACRTGGRRAGGTGRTHPQCRRDLPRRHTPEAIGDYVAGPNHVLPTARSRAVLVRSRPCSIS